MQNFKEQYWFLSTVILGIVSGLISYNIYFNSIFQKGNIEPLTSILYYMPGLFFGLFSLAHFLLFSRKQIKIAGWFIWLVSSALSFVIAVSLPSLIFKGTNAEGAGGLFIIGLTGIIVLLVPFHFIFCKLKLVDVLLLLVIATLSALAFSYSFFVWQTLVLSVFGYLIDKQNVKYLHRK